MGCVLVIFIGESEINARIAGQHSIPKYCNPSILPQSVWIAKNENWIAAGLQNIETLNFVCFDCPSTSMVQSMYEHTLFLRLQHCPGRHWCCSHGPNPPAILIDCTRTIRIVNDCKNLRNHDCDGLAQDFVDCNRIVTDYRPTIGSAIQKIASQSTNPVAIEILGLCESGTIAGFLGMRN